MNANEPKTLDVSLLVGAGLLALSMMTGLQAEAGWFGPSDYDECLEDIVSTITDEKVARRVRNDCWARFNSSSGSKEVLDCTLDHVEGLGSWLAYRRIRNSCSAIAGGTATSNDKCFLKKLEGVQTDNAARAIIHSCSK